MKQAGQYTGADGREYRWSMDIGEYWLEVHDPGWGTPGDDFLHQRCIAAADWPAAKAALDELIESEAGEWVEVEPYLRISPDGTRVQWNRPYHGWIDFCGADTKSVQAYRKGREVAQQECSEHYLSKSCDLYQAGYRKGREVKAAESKELVDAVLEAAPLRSSELPWITWEGWDRITELAKAVQS